MYYKITKAASMNRNITWLFQIAPACRAPFWVEFMKSKISVDILLSTKALLIRKKMNKIETLPTTKKLPRFRQLLNSEIWTHKINILLIKNQCINNFELYIWIWILITERFTKFLRNCPFSAIYMCCMLVAFYWLNKCKKVHVFFPFYTFTINYIEGNDWKLNALCLKLRRSEETNTVYSSSNKVWLQRILRK